MHVSDDLSGFSLYELFRTEAESQTAILSEGILALETQSGDPSAIEPLMRAAHSLKGAARIVDMGAAERLGHALEDVFVAAQRGKIGLRADHIDVLLASVDLLSEVSRIPEGGVDAWLADNGARLDGQIATLHAIESGSWSLGGAAPAPSPEPTPPDRTTEEAQPEARTEDARESRVDAEPAKTQRKSRKKPPGRDATDRVAPEPDIAAPTVREAPIASSHPSALPAPLPDPAVAAAAHAPAPPAERAAARADAAAQPSAEPPERVVRVTAENLNRLMGLAGESLVQARQLRPLVDSLTDMRRDLDHLWEHMQDLDELIVHVTGPQADRIRERLVGAKSQCTHSIGTLGTRTDRLEDHARRVEDLAERLHHEVISSRLRPLIDGVRGFPRLVRDVARQLGKQVRFVVVGEQTGVDRDILDKLEAPLNHIIRNALDHGVEMPDLRQAKGKDPVATIRLEARHVAGMLQIRVTDDGCGIDLQAIRTKVIERGLAPEAMASQMTETELFDFMFLPGFSTKREVSSLSGRGVGLDVVQSMVQAVGGNVRVSSHVGSDTTFTLQLPITMSVIRALIVKIAGQPYAFPLSRLESIQRISADAVETIEGRPFFQLDGQAVGLVTASQVLELASTSPVGEGLPVAVLSDRGNRFGVVVDEFLGERDLDVRPVDPRLGKIPNINSVSVLEDGWPVLIIDVEDLVRSIDNLLHGRRFKLPEAADTHVQAVRHARRILVVDDSITVRELERQLLESRGYAVDVAVDGMDGWNAVRTVGYDLIVSDVDMPRMDGIQMVSLIKRDPRLRGVPVIIVSYKDREEDRIRGLEAGANSYLTKSSFHDTTFLDTVADLIGEAAG
jgi:two-component system sensor histidine kinase and response regulator WspE